MGQQEVYDFLIKNTDSWYTSKEISEQLAVSIGSVTMSLKKLRKTNIIKYRNTGKRNTFQYMVQSEPAKLTERKTMMEPGMVQQPDAIRARVKIKPKIVHQHTYMSGQTFYGVIRPKEEVDAIERFRAEQTAAIEAKAVEHKITAARIKRAMPAMTKTISRRSAQKRVVRKTLKPRSTSYSARTASRVVKTKRVVKSAKPTKRVAKPLAKKTAKKARR